MLLFYMASILHVVLQLNFAVAFLLIRKTWDDGFAGEVGGWRILRYWGDDFAMGGLIPFTDYE